MLNLLLKTRQNSYAVNTRGGYRCRKHVRLRQPAWAVAGYATYILHLETQKLSAIDKRFSTCRECMEQLPPGCLLKYNHVLPQTNGAAFQVFIVSLSRNFVHERGVIWLLTFPKNTEHQRKKPSLTSCRHWKKTNTYAHLANGGTCRAM